MIRFAVFSIPRLSAWRIPGALASLMPVALLPLSALAQEPDPRRMSDRTWMSLSGDVVSAEEDSFELDYGGGVVTIEMDRWNWYQEGLQLPEGEYVTVYAYVDDDVFNRNLIEANSIYVPGLDSFFFAAGADEETSTIVAWVPNDQTVVNGTVMSIGEDGFTVDTGLHTLTISTAQLGYDPFDDEGYQKIEVGDRVAAIGELDKDFFEEREFEASRITSLAADSARPSY